MRIITDPSDMDDPRLRNFLKRRFKQLAEYDCAIGDLAQFFIIQIGDDITPLMTNHFDGRRYGEPDFEPSWEFVTDHGGMFEAVFILDDAGFGRVYFIPDCPGINADLRTLCRAYAIKPQATQTG